MNKLLLSSFIYLLSASVSAQTATPEVCVENKQILLNELVPLQLNGAKTTIGIDETLPVKALIEQYIVGNPGTTITDVEVISSSSKIPANKKKPKDEINAKKNMDIAQQRSEFVGKSLKEIQTTRPSLSKVRFSTSAVLAGPEFDVLDLNTRWMSRDMTPGYKEMLQELYKNNKNFYEEAFIKSPDELLTYPTLFEAKFKPFQGFRVLISGFNKKESKCADTTGKTKVTPSSKSKSE